MSIIKQRKMCDYKGCGRTKNITSITIMEQVPYKLWFTIHGCQEHKDKLEKLIKEMFTPNIVEQIEE